MDRFIITNGNKYICYHYDSGRHIVSVSSWERNDRSSGPIEEKEIPCGSYYEFFRMTEEIKTTSDIVIERSEEHTSELQSPDHLVCRFLLEKKKTPRAQPAPHQRTVVADAAGHPPRQR